MSRSLSFLLLGALLAGLSMVFQEPDADAALESESARLQRQLDKASNDLSGTTKALADELADANPSLWWHANLERLSSERQGSGTVFVILSKDSLLCWSGRPIYEPLQLWHDSSAHITRAEDTWLHVRSVTGDLELHGLRPIWRTPTIENRYLTRSFHRSFHAPSGLWATTVAGLGPVLHDANGEPMLRLGWRDGALEIGDWLRIKLLVLIASAGFLIASFWLFVMMLVRKGHPWTGSALFMVGLVLLRLGSLASLPTAPLDRLPLFDPAVYATSFAFASLGDLLINALLLILLGAFLWSSLRSTVTFPRGPFLALLGWGVIHLLAAWVKSLMIGLVHDSSINLDLYHVQGLNWMSIAALFAMAILLSAWLLVTATFIDVLLRDKPIRSIWPGALIILAIAVAVHHLVGVVDTVLFLWPVPLILLLLHTKAGAPRFVHVVLGLALIAAFGSHVLNRQTTERERRERQSLAEKLATREDPVVEQMFREMSPRLRMDRKVHAMLTGDRPCGPTELDQLVRQSYFSGYWERYDVRLFAFGPEGEVLCATDPEPPRSFTAARSDYADPTAASDMPDLFIEEQSGRSPYYHARLAVMPADSLTPVQLIIELYPRSAAQGLGFPSLLLAGDDPMSRRADRYSYARYENGMLVERSGNYRHPLSFVEDPGVEQMIWYDADGYRHLAKGDQTGTLILLSLPITGLLDKATTFSYLFAVFSILLALILLLRTIALGRGSPTMGIGAKVRVALILFAVAGLVFFGIGTQRLLARQYEQRFEAAILEKARSVHQELQQRMDGEPVLNASHAPYLDHLLARMSNVFFTDITVYNTVGSVLSTSRPQIFAAGLLSDRMDPVAFDRLSISGLSAFAQQESIGTAGYMAAYMPLRDREGMVLAYIALPGFADQGQQEQERAGVLVAVVNLFVLLFALSVLVAVFISYWTARPLDLLRNALARVALQGANEPIRYRGDDEVGRLVEVYNRKVDELRESAEQLARSERESAWREMARQVAHEIKNPLTPMKLSIQHFQRTWKPGAADSSERLERFSKGMVEQIDALSGIAGAFSDFARMPRAMATALDLCEVAGTALSTFDASPGVQCTLSQSRPGPLIVHADRDQLIRVFNNLIKNAIQSIPDDREGRIAVVLRVAEDEAIAEVRDNGTGIPEADRDHIFWPNFTTKGSGMGLGLAMVQRMVETAGGRVWFETHVNVGTTFFVALPLKA